MEQVRSEEMGIGQVMMESFLKKIWKILSSIGKQTFVSLSLKLFPKLGVKCE